MSSNVAYNSVTAGSPTRQPEVLAGMDELAMRCATLDEQLSVLEDRLQTSILAQRSDAKEAGASVPRPPEPVRVPLAQRIYDHSSHLSRLSERLRSIIDRIEA